VRARTVQIVPIGQSQRLVRRSPRFPLAARSRFAACSDERLCREERRSRRWWLTGRGAARSISSWSRSPSQFPTPAEHARGTGRRFRWVRECGVGGLGIASGGGPVGRRAAPPLVGVLRRARRLGDRAGHGSCTRARRAPRLPQADTAMAKAPPAPAPSPPSTARASSGAREPAPALAVTSSSPSVAQQPGSTLAQASRQLGPNDATGLHAVAFRQRALRNRGVELHPTAKVQPE
jgi:hypothetical protein